MKNRPERIKNALFTIIRRLCADPELVARDPERDFTRRRKLWPERLVKLLLTMGGGDLNSELLEHFNYSADTPSASAFSQQRAKLRPELLEQLFQAFQFKPRRLCRGYRLLAVDGSDVQIPTDLTDTDSYFEGTRGHKGFNVTKIAALYDLMDRSYADAIVQGKGVANENKLLVEMTERLDSATPTIIVADRNYECYDTMAKLDRKGLKYLIRAKEHKGIASGLDLPDMDEFDMQVDLRLTRKKNISTIPLLKERNKYRFIPGTLRFDMLNPGSNAFYHLPFRIVRFKLTEEKYEILITNLDPEEFPLAELKKLYAKRWGVETSFRELKYTVGLLYFHSKKSQLILQEIWARLTMYNFIAFITDREAVHIEGRKHAYRENFANAVTVCRRFFRGLVKARDVVPLLKRQQTPERPERSSPRKVSPKEPIGFNYRMA